MEGNTRSLVEMGFSEDQAKRALVETNNDIETAIGFLFEEPIESTATAKNKGDEKVPGSDSVDMTDTVAIKNPSDIPNFNEYHEQNVKVDNWNYNEQQSDYTQSSSDEIDEVDESINESSIYDTYCMPKKEGEVPALVANRIGFLENYYLPVVTILSQISSFNDVLLNELGVDYSYDPGWAHGNCNKDIHLLRELDKDEDSLFFIKSMQKLFGFLNGLSNRAFIGFDSLIFDLPDDVRSKLSGSEVESTDDFLPTILESLQYHVEKIFKKNIEELSFFRSVVESVSEKITSNIYTFDVDFENRHNTVQESFSQLFWGTNFDMLDEVKLLDTSSIVTVHFLGDNDSFLNDEVELEELFYPGLYHADYTNTIKEMNSKRLAVLEEASKINSKLIDLSTFEGKRVTSILDTSINHFKRQGLGTDDLESIYDGVSRSREALSERLESLSLTSSRLDVRNYKNIISSIEETGLKLPTPYLPVGVILSENEFYYRSRNSDTWIYQKNIYNRSRYIIDKEIDRIDFETVRTDLKSYSLRSANSFIVVYASSELCIQKETKNNKELQVFFDYDNKVFAEEHERKRSQHHADLDMDFSNLNEQHESQEQDQNLIDV